MTIVLKSLLIDTAAERKGEWVPLNEWAGLNPDKPWEPVSTPGLTFHVRSINDPEYRTARQKLLERLEQMRKDSVDGTLSQDVIEAAEGKLIADCLLGGWRGLDEEYSPAVAAELLPKPDAKPIRDMVLFCANKVGRRKAEFVKDAVKN